MKKALVAMSGGVDSAVASLLLIKAGYAVTGATMVLWKKCESVPDSTEYPPDENALEAERIAELLGFSHVTTALGESFRKNVIDRFVNDYRYGRTPNPCVECNRTLKFGALFEIANRLSIPYLATGHYAKIEKTSSGDFALLKATDGNKDQSYFLWGIKKERLPFILFPLGDYTKPQIRQFATENGFCNASRSDSQDICFIDNGDYMSFIKTYSDDDKGLTKGNFIDTSGNVLGVHCGIANYTIGQRKGLGIALGSPAFVKEKDMVKNTVTLCTDRELYTKKLSASGINILIEDTLETPTRVEAKIRYRHTPEKATVIRTDEDKLILEFDEPQRAIAGGQSLVLYDGDRVLGGGIID